MSKKKLKTDGIFFTGKASDDVTGSQYYIRFGPCQCLLECGLHQSSSNSYLDSYKINSEKFKFKPSEIDFVFVAHPHIDHCGLLPRLVHEGFHGRIIATHKTAEIMKLLLINSCHILNDESKILSKQFGRNYKPIYEITDVYNTFDLIYEYDDYNQTIKLNDTVSFQWLSNSHCLGAAQLYLILSTKEKTKKILYTSDLGALHTDNHFLPDTQIPTQFVDCVLMESTYGDEKRDSRKTRKADLDHLKSTVETAIDRGGSVVFPCFSFSRTQEVLTSLYDLFGTDSFFNKTVLVDSKLSCDVSKAYNSLLDDADLDDWQKVYNWKNVKFVSEKDESDLWLADNSPKIIISSSGFCTNGRIVKYLKKYIADPNSIIVFSGYTGDNPSYLSYRVKNYRDHKFISINKLKIPNKADCISLTTFSSHANSTDLIKFGSSLNTNKLVLVHGTAESKSALAKRLKEAISNNNKTYRVVMAFRGMVVHL